MSACALDLKGQMKDKVAEKVENNYAANHNPFDAVELLKESSKFICQGIRGKDKYEEIGSRLTPSTRADLARVLPELEPPAASK